MTAQLGKNILIYVDTDGAGDFQQVGGLREGSVALSNGAVDITHQGSTNRWRELLNGGAVKSMDINGSGVFQDDAQDETIRSYVIAGTIRDFQIVIPDFGTFEGPFHISNWELRGEHTDAVLFTIGLQSAGEPAWTAA